MYKAALFALVCLLQDPAAEPDRSTPRRSLEGFLDAASAGDYARAGRYLDVDVRREDYARDLHALIAIGLPDALARVPDRLPTPGRCGSGRYRRFSAGSRWR